MKQNKNKENNSKLSTLFRSLFPLSLMGISIYIVLQNNKILKLLNPTSRSRNLIADFSDSGNNVPLTIHRTIHEEDEEYPVAKRRFLTG